ncbi:MAG TPA: alpha/beta fold hydrolase [Polyangiales bacterium]
MLALMPRSLFIEVPGTKLRLEGRLTGEGNLAIVAPPHPLYGGTIQNPVVRTLESALQRRGMATLAFNFRGTGDSDGEPSGDLNDARVDYRAAADAVGGASLFAGYSFGSVTALACAVERGVPQLVMVAPPLALLDTGLLADYRGQLSMIIGDLDEYMPQNAVQDFFIARPNTRVEVLTEVDHYFLGSAIDALRAGLSRLLAA